jgi:hypothetical protein
LDFGLKTEATAKAAEAGKRIFYKILRNLNHRENGGNGEKISREGFISKSQKTKRRGLTAKTPRSPRGKIDFGHLALDLGHWLKSEVYPPTGTSGRMPFLLTGFE